jgi:metal-responsive CopG/Arc/MetJ family transcriptional regulator
MFGVREAKKRVECKLEEEVVDRIDRVAELLKTNRTDIIKSACIAYLKNIEIGAKKMAGDGQ